MRAIMHRLMPIRQGQFRPRHDDLTLLRIVRAVSVDACPAEPTACRQDQFDAARAAAGHPDAPRGRNIAARLDMSWPRLLHVAHGPETRWSRELGHAGSDRGRKGISLQQVLVALRQVAAHLGVDTLGQAQYEQARNEIVAVSRRAFKHGGNAAATLPHLEQVKWVLKQEKLSWDDALGRVGLKSPDRPSVAGLDPDAAVDAFIAHTGMLPRNRQQLRRWASAARCSFQDDMSAAAVKAVIAARRAARETAGEPPLAEAPRDLSFDDAADPALPRARRLDWNPASIIVGMAKAVPLLEPGERLDQRSLKRISKDHPEAGVPSWSTVDRYRSNTVGASFEDWRRQALELAAQAPSARFLGTQPPAAGEAAGEGAAVAAAK